MGFWGIEVKPGKPYPYHSDDVPGRLHITQATLGLGSSKERSIVQCTIGHKSPIFLCSLLPNRNESCSLNLEFDEDDLVAFSVIGPQSVHLSGYFEAAEEDGIRDDYGSDLYGEDIADSESGESDASDEFDTSDEYADEFSDSDEGGDSDMYDSSPVRKSGVVIEEIVEEPENGNSQSKQIKNKSKKKKNQPSGSVEGTDSQQQIVVRGESGVPVLESEDEDGFPISVKRIEKTDKKKKTQVDGDGSSNLKRKVENTDEGLPEKKKKNKNKKQPEKQAADENSNEKQSDELVEKQSDEKNVDVDETQVQNQSDDKKKKKKNKKKVKANEEGTTSDQTVSAKQGQKKPSVNTEKKQADDTKSSQVRTFPNGLVIEEVSMGKPDGKRASPGKMVFVRYIGKLQKNGKIFDSNVGKSPFKFRLGTGMVISGWDVGVNGMRVGDKRRLTIPPEMGYGSKGAGGVIPPNAWLMFDVELVDVR